MGVSRLATRGLLGLVPIIHFVFKASLVVRMGQAVGILIRVTRTSSSVSRLPTILPVEEVIEEVVEVLRL